MTCHTANPARILIVEDDADLARLLAAQLREAGHQVIGIAGGGEEAIRLAQSGQPDLVIMDIVLPGGQDGIETATLLVQRQDIAVLYLTAYAEEELYARARATSPLGYLHKPYDEHELRRAIELALDRHTLLRRLKASEANLAEAQTVAQMGSWYWDLTLDRVELSAELLRLLGLTPGGFEPRFATFQEMAHADDRPKMLAAVEVLLAGDDPGDIDVRQVRADGSKRVLRLRGHARRDVEGRATALLGTARDVTEEWRLKQAAESHREELERAVAARTAELSAANARLLEEIGRRRLFEEGLSASEQRYRGLVEYLPEPVMVLQDERVVFANPALARLLGLPAASVALGRAIDDLVHAESRAACAACKQACQAGAPPTTPTRIMLLRADGGAVEVEMLTFPFDYEQRPAILAVLHDLSERRAMEQIAERFRAALDSSADAFFLIDPRAMLFLDVSTSACASLGYSRDQLLQLGPQDIKPLLNRAMLRKQFTAVSAGQAGAETLCTLHQRQDGTTFPVEVRLRAFTSGDQELIVAIARDISAQQASEAALHETDARFRQLAESIDEAFWIRDLRENRVLYANPAYERLYGRSVKNLYRHPRSFLASIHPDDRDRIAAAYEQQYSQPDSLELEYRVLVDGQVRWLWVRTFPIRDAEGKVYRRIGLAKDITERRQADERYQTVIQASMDGFWFIDAQANLLDANEAASRMTGYSREELRTLKVSDLEAIETPETTQAHIRHIIEQGYDRFETRHRRKDGREIDVEVSVYHQSGGDGRYFSAFIRDITERKATDLALRDSEYRYRSLVASLPGIAYRCAFDTAWSVEIMSGEVEQVTGYPASDFLQGKRTYADIIHPDDRERVWLEVERGVSRHENYDLEYRLLRHDGSIRDVHERGHGVYDAAGRVQWLDGFIWDITERRQAEQALIASEERYRSVVEDQTELICRLRADGTLTFVNPVYCRFFDKREDELTGTTWHPAAHPDDVAMIEAKLATLSPSNPVVATENRVTSGQGQERWMQFVNRAFYDATGGLTQIQSVGRDITDRKLAEESLRKSEIRFRSYFDLPLVGIAITSPEKGWLDANQRLCDILGYARDELIRLTWTEITYPDDVAGDVAQFERVLAGQSDGYSLDKRFIRKDGRVIYASISVRCVRGSDGKPDYFVALVQDISERKAAEQALHAAEQFKQAVLDAVNTQVAVLDAAGVIVDVNAAWRRFAAENARVAGQPVANSDIGANYLSICETATGISHEGASEVAQGIREVLAGERAFFQHEYPCHAPLQQRWFQLSVTPLAGGACGVVVSHSDISAPRMLAEELRQSEARTRSILRAAPVGIGMLVDRVFQVVNEGMTQMTGYAAEELLGQSARMIYPTQADFDYVGEEKYRQIGEQDIGTVETRWRRKDGTIIDVALSSAPIVPGDLSHGVTFTAKDITGEKRAEQERLAHEAAQRDALVREVHHRIKNNLQGVIGLLRQHVTQFPATQVALEAAIAQINSIAVVYGLQGRMPQSALRLRDLLREIVAATTSLALLPRPPRLLVTLPGEPQLEAGSVVSIALILNELIHNAIKHGRDADSMEVHLSGDSSQVTLRIVNAGGPLPTGLDLSTGQGCGTGLDLIRTLLPRRGASLSLRQLDVLIETELVLTAPLIKQSESSEPPASLP
ncbi:MAG: Multi-sensor signal transduction histidine kinase [bacterium]|nr:MAG: Multi-sensor signal transduction histidine kinase [bacterium]KAF0148985.1 MAG: Multi-sensor signal transduction histidine kinase [bacterium]KAF0168376.1 MAG: Multi-sensor signal transduction histidine kinase [bacterium]TXT21040.1 MAG: Multi-sensor signal transduction histidine kinase [bacterium]